MDKKGSFAKLKSMLTAFCLTLLILQLLALSIISEAKLNLDFYGSKNYIALYLLGLKVLQMDVSIFADNEGTHKIKLTNKSKVVSEMAIKDVANISGKDVFQKAVPKLLYNLDILGIYVYTEYGAGDAFKTAAVAGILKGFVAVALRRVVLKQQVNTHSIVKANFKKRTIIFKIDSIISLTFADIIYGIIFSKKKEKNYDIAK